MYDKLLNSVAQRKQANGGRFQPPCSIEAQRRLRLEARSKLEHDIPDEYCRFLDKTNGLDWNGLVVYASERSLLAGRTDAFVEGFIDGNLDFRDFEPMKEYLIFADDGLALYTYHITTHRYEVILRVGLSVMESFGSFDELLADALSAHL